MTRLELLAIMYSIKRMCKKKDYEGVEEVVDKIITEGESIKSKKMMEED